MSSISLALSSSSTGGTGRDRLKVLLTKPGKVSDFDKDGEADTVYERRLGRFGEDTETWLSLDESIEDEVDAEGSANRLPAPHTDAVETGLEAKSAARELSALLG